MGTFIIWLVIVALILLRSARQNKQEKAKNAKNTKGYTYPKTHPTESYPKSSPVSRKHSKPQEPKENVFTRAKRNVSEDFSKDKLSGQFLCGCISLATARTQLIKLLPFSPEYRPVNL